MVLVQACRSYCDTLITSARSHAGYHDRASFSMPKPAKLRVLGTALAVSLTVLALACPKFQRAPGQVRHTPPPAPRILHCHTLLSRVISTPFVKLFWTCVMLLYGAAA